MNLKWQRELLLCAWAVLAPALLPSTATADVPDVRGSVQELYDWCKQPRDSVNFGYCLGFISGVGQMLLEIGPSSGLPTPPTWWMPPTIERRYGMCKENKVTFGAMVQAFLNWAEQNPRQWEKPALFGVAVALSLTWPCSTK
jgi:hypothetical protein